MIKRNLIISLPSYIHNRSKRPYLNIILGHMTHVFRAEDRLFFVLRSHQVCLKSISFPSRSHVNCSSFRFFFIPVEDVFSCFSSFIQSWFCFENMKLFCGAKVASSCCDRICLGFFNNVPGDIGIF